MRWITFLSLMIVSQPAFAEDWTLLGGIKAGLAFSQNRGVSDTVAESVPVDLNFARSGATSATIRPYLAIGVHGAGFLELAINYHDVEFQDTTRKRNILGQTYERLTQVDEVRTLQIPLLLRFPFIQSNAASDGLQNLMWGFGGSLNHQFSHELKYSSDSRDFVEKNGVTTIDGVQHRPNLQTYFAAELTLSIDVKLGKFMIPFELGASINAADQEVEVNAEKTIATQAPGFEWQIFLVSGIGYEFFTF